MTERTLSEILGDFAYELSFKDLPLQAVEKAEISVADGVACALAGGSLPSSQIALSLWQEMRKEGQSTVWLNGARGDLESTAWVNCLLMHSILQDDMQSSTVGHVGSMIIPTALAAAEQEGKGGADLLTSVVAAYEVAARIGVKSGQKIVSRGFRGSPIFGPFAAATAIGKLIGLTREQLRSAIALAANFSCGLLEASNNGCMEWRFQNGVALRNGIMAAKLAKRGLVAAPTTLEGECGLFTAFGGPELRAEIMDKKKEIVESLGRDFEITKNVFKPFATCGYNQIGVDVALAMAKQHNIRLQDVESVQVFVSPENKCYPGGDYHGPFTTIDKALLSKSFSVAAAVKYGDLTPNMYLSKINDPDIAEMAKRISTISVEGMDFLETRIEFRLKGGKVISGDHRLVDMVNYSLDKERMVEKFRRLSSNCLDKDKATKAVQSILNISKMSNMAEFSKLFS